MTGPGEQGGPQVPDPAARKTAARNRYPRVLLRVLLVQVVALALLWFLQSRYGG